LAQTFEHFVRGLSPQEFSVGETLRHGG
jgi:hypothetical protein